MSRAAFKCHVCERERDEWARDEDVHVAIRNGLYYPACWSCWFKWPDGHKTWPREGFGTEPKAWPGRVPIEVRIMAARRRTA